jgi:hypothetical protein
MNSETQTTPRLTLDALLDYVEGRGIEVKWGEGCKVAIKIPPRHDTPETRRTLAANQDKLLEIAIRRRLFELRSQRPPRGPDHPGRWDDQRANRLIEVTLERIHDLFLSLPLHDRPAALRSLEGASLSIEQWAARRDLLGLSRILAKLEFKIARVAAELRLLN